MDLKPRFSERRYRSMRRSLIMTSTFMMAIGAAFVLMFATQAIKGEAGMGWPGAAASIGFVLFVFALRMLLLWWYRKLYEMSSERTNV